MVQDFDKKNMPFRRLGRSGLRIPLFSLGACEYSQEPCDKLPQKEPLQSAIATLTILNVVQGLLWVDQ